MAESLQSGVWQMAFSQIVGIVARAEALGVESVRYSSRSDTDVHTFDIDDNEGGAGQLVWRGHTPRVFTTVGEVFDVEFVLED